MANVTRDLVERGEVVAALVVLDGDASPGRDMVTTLQRHVRTVTAPHRYPRVVRFVDALPRTSTGEAARGKGRELLAASEHHGDPSRGS